MLPSLLLSLLLGTLALPPAPNFHNGVNLGGWLLTEPSWMYDKFHAPAEGDLVARLRAQGGDTYAVTTMINHWEGYIPEAALDLCAALGLTHVRIPIPYWALEAPVVPVAIPGPPPRHAYGFNHEGFVTGGLNHLEDMLARLKARGLRALIDLHALPGGSSACNSYAGWQVAQPLFWRASPPADASTPIASGCGGGAGPYYSSRGAAQPWSAVGLQALQALGAWVVDLQANASLADAVAGIEVVNEPGCCVPGWQEDIERFTAAAVPPLQAALRAGGLGALNVTINFIGPNDKGVGPWVAAQVQSGAFAASQTLVDFHNYYNWDGPMSWGQLAARICGTTRSNSDFSQFTDVGLPVVIGEWSLSTNNGAPEFTDLGNASVRAHLRTLYANQMSLFSARGGSSPGAVGQHHWALRMGSGWDPRPTPAAPRGAQTPGSAWDTSLPGFWPAVWGLGELARLGVAVPLAQLQVTGVCQCAGCSASGAPAGEGAMGVPSADHSFTLLQPAMKGVRVFLRDSPGDNPSIEPWAYLNGGNFSGPSVPSSPDPLVSYRWFPSANTTPLQCYDVLPVSAAPLPGTPPASFSGLSSLSSGAPHAVVSGAGSFWVDFGVESPAWLEVDTAAPLPPGDAALISLGLSESTSPLPNKWRAPTPHGLTLRLETNAQLYEGLRCGFFNMSAPPSAPFTITAVRAVAQAKPVNYTGAFSAPGAPLLERLWYTAVYGVRANLELVYFGAVLVDRGDRISWTGDAYIAQGAALVAFNNFDFVLKNLLHTAAECNGIASYCVYWTLAAADYLASAGNGTTAALLAPTIERALAAADANAFAPRPDLGSFYGWDDRLGSGFQNASTDEAVWDFRFLVVRALGVRAGTLAAAGNASGAAFWAGRAAAGAAWLRNALGGAAWATSGALGVHAAAAALAAPGFAQPGEAAAALSATLNDAATICSLSPFNTFFILEGLAAVGAIDKGVAVAERCWGGMLALGATCFWEVFSPEWALFMRRGPSEVPWGYNGNTSLCHPWSSGVAQWLTKHVAGLRAEAGGTRVRAAPHLPPALAAPARSGRAGAGALAAALPLPGGGAAALRVAPEGVEVDSPVPVSLVLSEVLLARLGWARGGALRRGGGGVAVEVGGASVVLEAEEGEAGPLWEEGGALAGSRSAAAVLHLPPGATRVVRAPPLPAAASAAAMAAAAAAPVFPPLSWPARLVQFDTWTRGSWRGAYGGAGHILFNYKGGDAVALPPWVASWQITDGYGGSWARDAGDARALLDDPANASAPASIGFYQGGQNALPQYTFGLDVALEPGSEGRWWQAALYLADFDGAARRNVVEVKSGWPLLNPIAPPQLLEGFEGGVWLVYQLNTSARFRVSQMPSTCPGHTAVVSAIVFDEVERKEDG
jgi:hypothetical protein